VTGSIDYSFTPDFPESSRDRVKTAEILAAQDLNRGIDRTLSEWELRRRRIHCLIQVASAYKQEMIQLHWGMNRINSHVRTFVASAENWVGLKPRDRSELDEALFDLLAKDLEVAREPSALAGATEPAPDEPAGDGAGPAVSTAENGGTDRRAAVDAYIEEVFKRTGKRITRTDIWKSARYKSRTEFERWERNDLDHPNKTAHERFTRILAEKPHLK
jgi:hypothetical protein